MLQVGSNKSTQNSQSSRITELQEEQAESLTLTFPVEQDGVHIFENNNNTIIYVF